MSNQARGTTTNMTKLASWDIDEYLGYSDNECIVCLTEKELYLLRNPLRQMEWSTRWTSEIGTMQPDIATIAEVLAFKMSGQNCIDFCQYMIDCINDPESGVSDAIVSVVGSSSYSNYRDVAQSQNNNVLADGYNPTCDLDILFGQCLQLVSYMDSVNRDILEIIEVLTNRLDMLADVIADITGLDESAIDAGISWIAFIQDSIAENYDAQITQVYLEEIACDLFCRARVNNCELTPTILYNCFKDRMASNISIQEIITETWIYLTSGTWTGQEIADFMFYSQMALRAQLGKVVDKVAFFDINTRLQIYSNDPDPDWSILCDECTTDIIVTFDELTTAEFTVTATNGQLSPATRNYDLQSTIEGNPTPSARSGYGNSSGLCGLWIYVYVEFPSVIELTSIDFDYWFKQPANNNLATGIYLYDINGDTIVSTRPTTASAQEQWNNFNFNTTQTGVKKILCEIAVIGNCAVFNSTNTDGYIDNIRIRGVPI